MDRLIQGQGQNSAEEYDRIYFERAKKPADDQDIRRWKRLVKLFKGGNLIDLGCLDSKVYPLLKKRMPYMELDYLGIDIAQRCIEDMQNKFEGEPKCQFEVMDLYDTKLEKESFDYVVLGEVIEHLEHPDRAIKEAMRILKKGGTLALSTPLNEAIEPGAVDKDRHLWSFDIHDIVKLLGSYGEVQTSTLGSEYFPAYVYHFPTLIAWCKKQHELA